MSDPRRRAADWLRHDLGRYIRFSAPAALETDTEALRQRLTRDVLATRSGPDGVVPATAIFDGWLREEGSAFEGSRSLRALRVAVEELRGLAARLPELGRTELERLDALTREIASEVRGL